MASLELGDPLAHRALQALLRAEATVRKRLALELEREGVTAAGFSVLVVLTTAGGSLELKTLRRRLGWSKANATEVTGTLAARGFVSRRRAPEDRRVVVVDLEPTGRTLVETPLPRSLRARHGRVRKSGRVREAHLLGALPEARGLGRVPGGDADALPCAASGSGTTTTCSMRPLST